LRAIAAVALLALATLAGLTLRPAKADGPEFGFSIVEDYSTYATPVSPSLYFKVNTAASFPCINYGIPTIVSLVDRHLNVDLGEITKPNFCLTEVGPATGHAELNLPDGDYTVTISSRGRTDTYGLAVTTSKTSLNSTSTSFTEPNVVTYYRHPVNSFAFYCSGLLFDESMCSRFADRLTSLSVEPLTFPNNGVWPYRANIGGYYAAPSQYFTYSDQSAWTEAKELLAEYVRNLDHNCGRLLEVTNWQDDHERSWEIRPNTAAGCQGVVIPTPSPSPNPGPSPKPSPTSVLTPVSLPMTGGVPESHARTPVAGGLALLSAVALAAAFAIRRRAR
jgi:hypothetical protein